MEDELKIAQKQLKAVKAIQAIMGKVEITEKQYLVITELLENLDKQ